MTMRDLGEIKGENWPIAESDLLWTNWKPIDIQYTLSQKRWTQFLDFETAHELFKTTFCFWLTAKEYEAAINSFQFDHSVGLRIDEIIGAAHFADLAHNRFPMILVGPTGFPIVSSCMASLSNTPMLILNECEQTWGWQIDELCLSSVLVCLHWPWCFSRNPSIDFAQFISIESRFEVYFGLCRYASRTSYSMGTESSNSPQNH